MAFSVPERRSGAKQIPAGPKAADDIMPATRWVYLFCKE